jgi:hypothetical protein
VAADTALTITAARTAGVLAGAKTMAGSSTGQTVIQMLDDVAASVSTGGPRVTPFSSGPRVGAGPEGPAGDLLPRPTHANAHGFSIRDINPSGNNLNCAECSVRVDDLLAGKPSGVAAPAADYTDMSVLQRIYQGEFSEPMTQNQLIQAMGDAGKGARGIVFGLKEGKEAGHFFNAVTGKNGVQMLDGQTGTAANPEQFDAFRLLRTNND